MTAIDLSTFRPATDLLIGNLRETLGQIQEHEHPERDGDLFCLNLTSYMGDRMGPVLRRLADEQAETRKWQERNTALADQFAAEADRLQSMLDAVDALHQRRVNTNAFGQERCKTCGGIWPCATSKAINMGVDL